MKVGILTYDSKIHVYNLKSSLKQPQMFVLSDLTDLEIPIPDELVVTLSESKDIVYTLLDSLPKMFENTQNNDSCFTFALEVIKYLVCAITLIMLLFLLLSNRPSIRS